MAVFSRPHILFAFSSAVVFLIFIPISSLRPAGYDSVEARASVALRPVGLPQAQGVTPCVNGMAGAYPCANVDLMAFLPTNSIGGGNTNDVWGWTDVLTGREYAIVGRTSGTSFVDITVPDSPVYLGNLPTHTMDSIWRDLEVHADHAFIVSEAAGHGMQVFDLRQLRSVVNPPATFSETAHYNGFLHAHTITINTQSGFAYVNGTETCSGGPHMINIQNPASPTSAGCFSADGYTHDAQCVIYQGPDAAHRNSEICFNSNEDTFTIVDVTNKVAPAMESRTGYSGSGYTHQGWLTTDHAFFLVDDELDERILGTNTRTHIWNVSDLHNPQRIGIYEAAVAAIDHNLFIRGNYAYQSNYRSGLRILDVTNIASASLREVAFFDVYPADDAPQFNGTWSNFPFFNSGIVALAGIEQGLFIVRPNLAGNPMGLPNFQLSASPQNAMVSRGQAATFTLTSTPQNAFSGTVTFTCLGVPANATCTFTPAQITPAAAPIDVTLRITTTLAAPPPQSETAQPFGAAAVELSCLLVALVFFLEVKKKGLVLLLAMVLLLSVVAAACGGGTTIAPPPPPPPPPPPRGGGGTPAGTYAITVRAASGALQHFTTVTLVVQ